jgi:hypothetical protein
LLLEKFCREGQSTGYQGCNYQDVAKEALFQMVFIKDLGQRPKKGINTNKWKYFGNMLD